MKDFNKPTTKQRAHLLQKMLRFKPTSIAMLAMLALGLTLHLSNKLEINNAPETGTQLINIPITHNTLPTSQ